MVPYLATFCRLPYLEFCIMWAPYSARLLCGQPRFSPSHRGSIALCGHPLLRGGVLLRGPREVSVSTGRRLWISFLISGTCLGSAGTRVSYSINVAFVYAVPSSPRWNTSLCCASIRIVCGLIPLLYAACDAFFSPSCSVGKISAGWTGAVFKGTKVCSPFNKA